MASRLPIRKTIGLVAHDNKKPDLVEWADLLVVGGPTHVHGMSSTRSRQAGRDAAHEPGTEMSLDPDAEGEGLRDWFHSLPATAPRAAAAFDTRTDAAVRRRVRTGKAVQAPCFVDLKTYLTEVKDGQVFVDLDTPAA